MKAVLCISFTFLLGLVLAGGLSLTLSAPAAAQKTTTQAQMDTSALLGTDLKSGWITSRVQDNIKSQTAVVEGRRNQQPNDLGYTPGYKPQTTNIRKNSVGQQKPPNVLVKPKPGDSKINQGPLPPRRGRDSVTLSHGAIRN